MRCSSSKIFHINASHLVISTHWINRRPIFDAKIVFRSASIFRLQIKLIACVCFYAIDEILVFAHLVLCSTLTSQNVFVTISSAKCECGNISEKKHTQKQRIVSYLGNESRANELPWWNEQKKKRRALSI